MLLLRKVTLAKWTGLDASGLGKVPADAITGCLRTTDNALSFWAFEREEELAEAQLAFLGAQHKLEKANFVVVRQENLAGCRLVNHPTQTAYAAREGTHYDLEELDLTSLSTVAQVVGEEIYGERERQMTRQQVKTLLQTGLGDGRLNPEKLHKDILAELSA